MTNQNKNRLKIDKKKEMRTKEISKMISEGGLGADKYYEIDKGTPSTEQEKTSSDNVTHTKKN